MITPCMTSKKDIWTKNDQKYTLLPRLWLCGDCNGLEWRQSLLSQWQAPKTTWSDVVRSWTSPSLKTKATAANLTRTPCPPRVFLPLIFSAPRWSSRLFPLQSKFPRQTVKILEKQCFPKINRWNSNDQQSYVKRQLSTRKFNLWHFPGKFG